VPDLVPTHLTVVQGAPVLSAADAWLVAGPDGRTPFAAVGRMPVVSEPELASWVAKLVAYERSRGAPSGIAVLAADDHNPYTGQADPFFQQESDRLAMALAPMQAVKVYLPLQHKPDLLAALALGPDLVSYHGHADALDWSTSGLFTISDVPALPAARPFFLVTVDCWDGMFAMPTFAPLTQAMAQAPQGGAVAALAASSLVDEDHDVAIDDAIFPALADPGVTTVGEVTRRAQAGLAAQPGPVGELVFVYNLIGDPATPLPTR
jgi:hypothetical protein